MKQIRRTRSRKTALSWALLGHIRVIWWRMIQRVSSKEVVVLIQFYVSLRTKHDSQDSCSRKYESHPVWRLKYFQCLIEDEASTPNTTEMEKTSQRCDEEFFFESSGSVVGKKRGSRLDRMLRQTEDQRSLVFSKRFHVVPNPMSHGRWEGKFRRRNDSNESVSFFSTKGRDNIFHLIQSLSMSKKFRPRRWKVWASSEPMQTMSNILSRRGRKLCVSSVSMSQSSEHDPNALDAGPNHDFFSVSSWMSL